MRSNAARRLRGIVLAFVCALAQPLAAQLLPASSEFQINEHTISTQYQPEVGADAAGNFVVVWSSYNQDTDGYGVMARRYDSSGAPLGGEFQVNTYTTNDQNETAVGVAPDGRFVVVWTSNGQDGSDHGVFGQRYAANGAALGTEFQVNTLTAGRQQNASIATDSTGGFVVAWTHADDGNYSGVFARRFDSSGVAQGAELQVNSVATGYQFGPRIARAGEGFVVTWSGDGNISARRLDGDAVPLGTEFRINDNLPSNGAADLAASNDGSFVVAWHRSGNEDGSGFGIFARTFGSTGVALGTEFQVNTYTTDNQVNPAVATDSGGGFVVAWRSDQQDGVSAGVFGRTFARSGVATGSEFQVNEYTSNFQADPVIANLGGGDFAMIWQSDDQDGWYAGVFGRLYRQAGQVITGKKLLIRTPPSGASGNGLTLVSSDPALVPPQLALEDPRCPPLGSGSAGAGARLRVVGTGGDVTIDLPCVNWSADITRTRYRYRDASGATCSSIVLRHGQLKVKCEGAQVAYSLGAQQGDVAVILSSGATGKYCAGFGPTSLATILRDGSDGRSYRAVRSGPGACL